MMEDPIKHKVKAYLHDNILTSENTTDMIARVLSERSLGIKEICESASGRGGAGISAAAMQYATELFLKEMTYLLCDGYSVNTGYFTAATVVKGIFNNSQDSFDPNKHHLVVQLTQGKTIRSELQNVDVEILGATPFGANITEVLDIKSGSKNDLLTPNRNLKISGNKIKVIGDSSVTGVFFINQLDSKRIAVDPADLVTNYPSQLMLTVPMLPPGDYILEIITQFSPGSTSLKHPRTITFGKPLTVQ